MTHPSAAEGPSLVLAVIDAEWQLGGLARNLRNSRRYVSSVDRHSTADMLTELANRLRSGIPQATNNAADLRGVVPESPLRDGPP